MISICILTKNASRSLKETLNSTRLFSDVVILDNGSQDETLQIAKSYPNVRVFQTEFKGFGPLRNEAASLALYDWILALDSDEVISQELMEEIQHLSLDPQKAYLLKRHNFYNGKRIRGCGWDSDWVARLYHRDTSYYCSSKVHEKLLFSNSSKLLSPLLHTPYQRTEDFLLKMQQYSTLFAEQHQNRKQGGITPALFHGAFAFFRSYILKRGIFCGKEGFLISLYNANTAFYKYIKLSEKGEN